MKLIQTELYFSDSNLETVAKARLDALNSLENGTIIDVLGIWNGKTEHGFIVRVIGGAGAGFKAKQLGKILRERYNQESVLVTVQNLDAQYIGS
jgi:hypothetical protein